MSCSTFTELDPLSPNNVLKNPLKFTAIVEKSVQNAKKEREANDMYNEFRKGIKSSEEISFD